MKVKVVFKEILISGNQNDINDFIIKNNNVYIPSDTAQYSIFTNPTTPILLDMNWLPCGYVGGPVLVLDSIGTFFGNATVSISGNPKVIKTSILNVERLSAAQTNYGNSVGVDNLIFTKTPITGTSKVKIYTNGVGQGSGHVYTNNQKWYKLYDYKTDTVYANPILLKTGGHQITVSQKGIYGYMDDDVTFGYFQIYIK